MLQGTLLADDLRHLGVGFANKVLKINIINCSHITAKKMTIKMTDCLIVGNFSLLCIHGWYHHMNDNDP